MKFSYKFQSILGSAYRDGNITFSPDGNSVISPIGNRVSLHDLKNNTSKTISVESRYNYTAVDISPNGCLIVAVNENGEASMISMVSSTVLNTYKFDRAVSCVRFSPDGRYFAIAKETQVFIFKTPGDLMGEYIPFVIHKYFSAASFDTITSLNWSDNSKCIIIGAHDNTSKIYGIEYLANFRPYVLGGHSDAVMGCYFNANSLDANTVCRNGQLCVWKCTLTPDDLLHASNEDAKRVKNAGESDDENDDEIGTENLIEEGPSTDAPKDESTIAEWKPPNGAKVFSYNRTGTHYLATEARKNDNSMKLTASAYHKRTRILVTAYSSGVFFLHELPEASLIHYLSISESLISSTALNASGDWIALAVKGNGASSGQLLVWEWQSEQYVMKQQGHSCEMTCVSYSPDGTIMATGGADSKVKLWHVHNGFCFMTFSEHTSIVSAIDFSASKKFLVSASLDGTVRAYDIMRYRNFRTFTTPQPVQFISLSLDRSGELVCAGAQDGFEIYLWSFKLGHLLEVLSGHEAPVVSLAFAPVSGSSTLISGSWDKRVKIWNNLESSGSHETIELYSDVTAVAFKPDGEEIAVATLNGHISFFNAQTSAQVGLVEGQNDLGSGVSEISLTTAKNDLKSKSFTTIAYSMDGECILAAGKSKNVCIFHIREGILLKKFEITQNHSLDGLDDFINRRQITEFGNLALIEQREELEGGNTAIRLPGVTKGDLGARSMKPEINVYSVRFSPTGQAWCAVTTEGLLIYSLDKGIVFDPLNLSTEVTPKSTRETISNKEYGTALVMALKLNEVTLLQEVIEQIPVSDIGLVIVSTPDMYLDQLLQFIIKLLISTPHIEYYMKWACELLTRHGQKDHVLPHHSLLTLHEAISRKYEMLSKAADFNKYTIKVLKGMAKAS